LIRKGGGNKLAPYIFMWHKDIDGKRESEKCKFRIASFCTGVGLDIGAREQKINPNALSVGATEACDVKANLHANDAMAFLSDEHFEYVFSSHLLEEFESPDKTLAEWWSKVKPGGYLILYCDDPGYSPKTNTELCRIEKRADLYWEDVWAMLEKIGNAKKVSATRHDEFNEYSWQLIVRKTCGFLKKPVERLKKTRDWGRIVFPRKKVTDKEALVIRYGAFGDAIWATPILRELKKQGYYIVYNTSEIPAQVVRENPNIDEFLIQEGESIPMSDDEDYWKYIGQSFDKVVNLCGQVEDKLLRVEGRTGYEWPHKKRHERCNKNYIDTLMAAAGFPDKKGELPELFFTHEEEAAAQTYMKGLEDRFVVLWSLSGSSLHKIYPHAEKVGKILSSTFDDIEIITVGDDMCRIMEWDAPHTQNKSGHFTIRQSMLLTKYVDLVIGPETGILNAASCYDTPKMVFLSHSSEENLTKYWKNCIALHPEGCPCHPCHQLHFSKSCPLGATGTAALCAENISAPNVFGAIKKVYNQWQYSKPDKKWVGFTIAYDKLSHRLAERVKKSFRYFHPNIPFFVYDASDEKEILGEVIDPGPYPAGVSMRPRVCEKLLKEYDGIIYLDVDTVVAARLDEFLSGGYEVAATLNVKGFGREALFNDGVFALTSKQFAKMWTNGVYDKHNNYNNDQYVFNYLTNLGLYDTKVVDAEKVYYNERSREYWGEIQANNGSLFCNNRQLKVLHWAGGFKVPGDKLSCGKFSDEVRKFLNKVTGTTDFTDIKGKDVWWPTAPTKPVTSVIRGLKVTRRTGVYARLPSDANVVNEVMVEDSYRLGQLERIIQPKVILDLGGHIGTFGLMAKKMWPDALLIAVEANKESCSFYKRNMIENNFKNYHILNYGLSYDSRETCLVEDFQATGGGILATPERVGDIYTGGGGDRTLGRADVRTITIEEIVKMFNLDSIDLAKWDIEGGELKCWEKMSDEAAAKFKYMIGEFHVPVVEGGKDFKPRPIKKAEFWEIAKDKFPHLVFDHYASIMDVDPKTGDILRVGIGVFEAIPKGRGEKQTREDFFC